MSRRRSAAPGGARGSSSSTTSPASPEMLTIVFEKEGYAVTDRRLAAPRGCRLLEETSPDLVLTDLRMPDGTGFDILREDARDARPRRRSS